MNGGAALYDVKRLDPRTVPDGATIWYGGDPQKFYQRRRRCEHCKELVDIRISLYEGMVCEKCAEVLKTRPLKLIYSGFISHYEYADAVANGGRESDNRTR